MEGESNTSSDSDRMLDFYIHDYLVKKGYKDSATSFIQEAAIHQEAVPIDCPGGFLLEWWLIFWDIFNAKNNNQFASMDAKYYMMYHAKQRQMNYRMKAQRQQQIMQQYAANSIVDLEKRSNSVPSPEGVHSPASTHNVPMESHGMNTMYSNPQSGSPRQSQLNPNIYNNGHAPSPLESPIDHADPSTKPTLNRGMNSVPLGQRTRSNVNLQVHTNGNMYRGLNDKINSALVSPAASMEGERSNGGMATASNNNVHMASASASPSLSTAVPLNSKDNGHPKVWPSPQMMNVNPQNEHFRRFQQQLYVSHGPNAGQLPPQVSQLSLQHLTPQQQQQLQQQIRSRTSSMNSEMSPEFNTRNNVKNNQVKQQQAQQVQMQQQIQQMQQQQAQQVQQLQQSNAFQMSSSLANHNSASFNPYTNQPNSNNQKRKELHPSETLYSNLNQSELNLMNSSQMMQSIQSAHVKANAMMHQAQSIEFHSKEGENTFEELEKAFSTDSLLLAQSDIKDWFADDSTREPIEDVKVKAESPTLGNNMTSDFLVLVDSLDGHSNKVSACAFDKKNQYFASAGHDKKVIIWSLGSTGHFYPLSVLDKIHSGYIICTQFMHIHSVIGACTNVESPVLLATCGYDKIVNISNIKSVKSSDMDFDLETLSFNGHQCTVSGVDFCPCAFIVNRSTSSDSVKYLISSLDVEGNLFIWDPVTVSSVLSFKLPFSGKSSGVSNNPIRFRPGVVNDSLVIAAAFGTSLYCILMQYQVHADAISLSETILPVSTDHSKAISTLNWSSDGNWLITASLDTLTLWNTVPFKGSYNTSQDPFKKVASIAISNISSCTFLESPLESSDQPPLILLGLYQSMQIWNVSVSSSLSAQTQRISCLNSCQEGGILCIDSESMDPNTLLVASASSSKKDNLKIWKYKVAQ